MFQRLLITSLVFFAVLMGLFFWERDFAVHSHHIEAQVARVGWGESTSRRVYHVEYSDPETGRTRRARIDANPWVNIVDGRFQKGDELRLRQDKRDDASWKFERWYVLYGFTLMWLAVIAGMPFIFAWKKLRGQI